MSQRGGIAPGGARLRRAQKAGVRPYAVASRTALFLVALAVWNPSFDDLGAAEPWRALGDTIPSATWAVRSAAERMAIGFVRIAAVAGGLAVIAAALGGGLGPRRRRLFRQLQPRRTRDLLVAGSLAAGVGLGIAVWSLRGALAGAARVADSTGPALGDFWRGWWGLARTSMVGVGVVLGAIALAGAFWRWWWSLHQTADEARRDQGDAGRR